MTNKDKNIYKKYNDAFNYFCGYRLEETNTTDTYYIKALLKYIEHLELKLKKNKNENNKQRQSKRIN